MTALQWLISEIQSFGIDTKFLNESINKALEMEKQQMATNSIQLEISDEEMTQKAHTLYPLIYEFDEVSLARNTDKWFAFMAGCKWYREQLKQRK